MTSEKSKTTKKNNYFVFVKTTSIRFDLFGSENEVSYPILFVSVFANFVVLMSIFALTHNISNPQA